MRQSSWRRRSLALALCLSLAAPHIAAAQTPPAAVAEPAALTAAHWREDLRFLVAKLTTRHPDPYRRVGRDKFEAAVAALDANLPTLPRNRIIVEMMRLAALIGDGHTRVDPRKDKAFRFAALPIKLYRFEDGLFVRAALPGHADLLGWKVERIGGVPIVEAERRMSPLISADSMMGKLQLTPLYLGMPDILEATGLSTATDRATLLLSKGGRRRTVTLRSGAVDPPWPSDTDIMLTTPPGWVDARATATPIALQDVLDLHRLIDLPAHKAIYVQLNKVTDLDSGTLDAFGERILERARSTGARSIILDLRFNQGGNGDLRNGLVRSLIRAGEGGRRLFVLTGRGTFSASQFLIDDLVRLADAIVIGEPASSSPSSFGDAFRDLLPNSGVTLRTSIYWWQHAQNFNPYTFVDRATPSRFADYAAGRDPALEAALRFVPPAPLWNSLRAAAAKGEATASAMVAAHLADPAHRYANVNLDLPRAAEEIFSAGHKPEALIAAKAVAQALPAVVDGWVVLSFVALENKRGSIAATAARKSLALDPNHRGARTLLENALAAGG